MVLESIITLITTTEYYVFVGYNIERILILVLPHMKKAFSIM